MLHLLRHDYNTAGHAHADRYVRVRPGAVPLRYPDFTPTGFHISRELALKNGRGPAGSVRLDYHERLSTPNGDLVFHRGGNGYVDAANVKYGHVAVADLLDDPRFSWPKTRPDSAPVRPSYRWRSEPQIAVVVIRTIASVGFSIVGSGTSSTRTSRFPCQVSAFMSACLPAPRPRNRSCRRGRT